MKEKVNLKNEEKTATIIDVRHQWEFERHHVAKAINIPLLQLTLRLPTLRELPGPLCVYSNEGIRSSKATTLLHSAGISNVIDAGSIQSLLE